ncbi:MAG: ChaN family lipoprotein [Spirochaetota bacterium]|nr:ChaN family lipoprotein [Spirochaetota bacterium]
MFNLLKLFVKHLKFLTALISFVVLSYNCNSIVKSSIEDVNTPIDAKKLYNKILSYDEGKFILFNELISRLNESNVIFIGESHNSKQAHKYQYKILSSLYKMDKRIAVTLEMFERDVQVFLDKYLSGKISESVFLAHVRPWKNYSTDYRPIIEFAKAHKLKVIAMNTPNGISKKVIKSGKNAILKLNKLEKSFIAKKINFNDNQYKKYFYGSLPKNHPGIEKHKAMIRKFFIASLIKDATMAESIVLFLKKPEYVSYKLISINGKFHSDYGIAIPKMVKSLKPNVKVIIISLVPVSEKDKIILKNYLSKKIADFIIFTDDSKSYTLKILAVS